MTAIDRKIISFLSRREHSQKELREKLKRRNFEMDEINLALQKFTKSGLQSDFRFAEIYVQMRLRKGYGITFISEALKKFGIAEEIIDSVLKNSEALWLEKLSEIYKKKFKNKPIENATERAKRIRFLQYRGFTFEQINKIIDQKI